MRELVLNCLEAQAEALSDALLEAGVLSVSVEDADSDTEDEQALVWRAGHRARGAGMAAQPRCRPVARRRRPAANY